MTTAVEPEIDSRLKEGGEEDEEEEEEGVKGLQPFKWYCMPEPMHEIL